jgi:DNA replication initiation complex subunit (GINS family)
MISISKIVIDINDKKIELTTEEAKELYESLKNLMDKETIHIITSPMRPFFSDDYKITCASTALTNGADWTVYHNKLSGK